MEHEGFIDVPGGRAWYRLVGDGRGTPLLCLHGGPGARSDYLAGLEVLAGDRPIIRYDQLGGGKAEYTVSDELWSAQRFVAELQAVRDALGLDSVHIYGHSWGTTLAVDYLLRGDVGVVSLVLASPWLSVPRYLEDIRLLVARLPGDAPATIEALIAGNNVSQEAADSAVATFYSEHFCRDEAKLAALFEGGPPGPAYEAMWGPNEFVCSSPVLADVDFTARLGQVTVPVLLLCGEHDSCTPATSRLFASLIPHSETVVLPGCSHMSILEDPGGHVAAVAQFLARADQLAAAADLG
jgi:proline iminopeptidase